MNRRPIRAQWPWLAVALIVSVIAVTAIFVTGSHDRKSEVLTSGLLVGLGDSFSSGEGLAPYDAGTDTSTDHCHRSPLAYPVLAAQQLGMGVRNVSCSGARTSSLIAGSDGEASQLAALNDATAVTVMIGGNDVDAIGSVISLPSPEEVRARLDAVSAPLVDTYTRVKKAAPDAKVYAVGYPGLVVDAPTPPPGCAFDATQISLLANGARDLDAVIKAAAAKAGIGFVSLLDTFKGHELCSTQPWINGLNLANLDASLHPSAEGQRHIAEVVAASIKSDRR